MEEQGGDRVEIGGFGLRKYSSFLSCTVNILKIRIRFNDVLYMG